MCTPKEDPENPEVEIDDPEETMIEEQEPEVQIDFKEKTIMTEFSLVCNQCSILKLKLRISQKKCSRMKRRINKMVSNVDYELYLKK